MKYIVYDTLIAHLDLVAKIPAENWWRTSPPDADISGMYAVLRWGSKPRGVTGHSGPVRLQIWFYDDPGSYDGIDYMLGKTMEVLTGVSDQVSSSGNVACIVWENDSPDLTDIATGKIVKYQEYTVI